MSEETLSKEFKFEKECLGPYTHILQASGKGLHVKIIRAFNHWYRVPEEKLTHIVDTIEMLRISTLLLDDMQDNSNVRRGMPAAHRLYGLPLTMNTVFHLTMLVLNRLLELGPTVVEIYAEDFLDAVRGQGIDIYRRDSFVCPTEEEHIDMIKQKTGRMFAMPIRMCQLFSDYKTDLTMFALQLGTYFQIRDDYCNLKEQEALDDWQDAEDGKVVQNNSFCEDLTEGKFSLSIVHAMGTPQKEQILNILRQRTEDGDLKLYCVSLLEQSGSLQYTYNVLLDLEKNIRAKMAKLGGNPALEAVLDEMQSWKKK